MKRLKLFFVTFCIGLILCSCSDYKNQESEDRKSDTQKEQNLKNSSKREKKGTKKQDKNKNNSKTKKEKVINNGSYFVKIGSDIYFRKYGEYALEQNVLFGNFLEHPIPKGVSWICRLNENGESENVFTDYGYGELYYSNRRLYLSEMSDDGITKSYSVNMDGSNRKELGTGKILGINENGQYLAIGDYTSAAVIDLKSKETPYIWTSEENTTTEFLGFTDKGFLLENVYSSESSYDNTLWQISGRHFNKPDDEIIIGYLNEDEYHLNPEFDSLTEDGDDFYLTFGYYDGTGHFLNSVGIYKGNFKEGSLEDIHENPAIQDMYMKEYESPILPLIFAKNGKIHAIAGGSDGEIDIQDGSVYKIDQNGRQLLVSELFEDDMNSQISNSVGKAEIVDGDLFLITFRQIYTPYQDIGWRMSYSLLNTEYIVVKKGEKTPKIFDYLSGVPFKQNAEAWKVGESTLLYRPLPDNPENYEFPKDIAYLIPISAAVTHDFQAQIPTVNYTEYGECLLPESEGEKLQLTVGNNGTLYDIIPQ